MSLKCCNVGAQTILDLKFYFPKNKMDECLVSSVPVYQISWKIV